MRKIEFFLGLMIASISAQANSKMPLAPDPEFLKQLQTFNSLIDYPELASLNQNGKWIRRTELCTRYKYNGGRGVADLVAFKWGVLNYVAFGAPWWVGIGPLPENIVTDWYVFKDPMFENETRKILSIGISDDNRYGFTDNLGSNVRVEFKKSSDAIWARTFRTDLEDVTLEVSVCPYVKTGARCGIQWTLWNIKTDSPFVKAIDVEVNPDSDHVSFDKGYNNVSLELRASDPVKAKKYFIDRCLGSGFYIKPYHLSGTECLDKVSQTFSCVTP